MTDIIAISFDSPAGIALRAAMADPNGYCIRIAPNHGGVNMVALKLNGGMWSAPLSTEYSVRPPAYSAE